MGPRRWGLRAACLVPVLLLAACAPRNPPRDTSVNTVSVGFRDSDAQSALDLRHQPDVGESTVPATLTSVWNALPAVFDRLEIDVAVVDVGSGTMGNPSFRARSVEGARMSQWLDCGRGLTRPNADTYAVTMTVMVRLLRRTDETTLVRTTVDAYARDRSVSGGSVHCVSWGRLERRVGELVMEQLGIAPPEA